MVNSDNGQFQIQNFDAFTGGGCDQNGQIRVLASQFIVNQQKCSPAAYQYLQIVQPPPGGYTDGTVTFEDSDGNPIPGAADWPIDPATGKVDLSGLNLDTNGLPQVLIKLNGVQGTVGQVVVKLVWTATYDPSCVAPERLSRRRTRRRQSGDPEHPGHLLLGGQLQRRSGEQGLEQQLRR